MTLCSKNISNPIWAVKKKITRVWIVDFVVRLKMNNFNQFCAYILEVSVENFHNKVRKS